MAGSAFSRKAKSLSHTHTSSVKAQPHEVVEDSVVQGFGDPSSKLYTAKFATVADEPPAKKPKKQDPDDEKSGATPKPKPTKPKKSEAAPSGLSPALAAMLAAAQASDDGTGSAAE